MSDLYVVMGDISKYTDPMTVEIVDYWPVKAFRDYLDAEKMVDELNDYASAKDIDGLKSLDDYLANTTIRYNFEDNDVEYTIERVSVF